jgi:hypothetical protein
MGTQAFCSSCNSLEPAFECIGINHYGDEEFGWFCDTCEAQHETCHCGNPAHEFQCVDCDLKLILKTEGELESWIEWLEANNDPKSHEVRYATFLVKAAQAKFAEAA